MSVTSLAKLLVGTLPGTWPVRVTDVLNQVRLPTYRKARSFERRMMRRLGHPNRILSGPFAGMPYGQIAFHSRYLPKILGTYEKEIHPFLERLLGVSPEVVIDIGAAEGFYAAGLAWRDPALRVIAFEAEKSARALLMETLREADVGARVEVRGSCTPLALSEVLRNRERAIILCDCEGAEDALLDPNVVTELRTAAVLVETHDMKVPGVSSRLRERFRDTHITDSAVSRLRTMEDYPGPCPLRESDALEAMFERAPGQEFLLMLPR